MGEKKSAWYGGAVEFLVLTVAITLLLVGVVILARAVYWYLEWTSTFGCGWLMAIAWTPPLGAFFALLQVLPDEPDEITRW